MKSATLTLVFLLLSFTFVAAQSESFQTLKDKFTGSDNVHSFATSGFFARTVLWMAGEHDFNKAVRDIRSIRLITIPKVAFSEQDVTLNGFKKVVRKDSFQELANVSDHGDEVTLFMQPATKNKSNRYLLLVDGDSEVVAIEIKGYIDPNVMLKNSSISYHQ
jgi:hypothetical protein